MDGHGGVRAIFAHSLERDRTWKVSARLVGALRNISWGESPSDSGGFHSNHDLRIEIAEGSELTVTNAVGARYRCRFDEQTLSIRRIEQGQEGTRFIVVRATDEAGREVGLYDESTLKNLAIQRLGGQSWRVDKGVARISVCVVVPEEVEAEFYIRAKESAQ